VNHQDPDQTNRRNPLGQNPQPLKTEIMLTLTRMPILVPSPPLHLHPIPSTDHSSPLIEELPTSSADPSPPPATSSSTSTGPEDRNSLNF
jgi:hypothetical protein